MQWVGSYQDTLTHSVPWQRADLSSAPQLFFGGVIDQDKQHLTYRQNFRGCVENIIFNGVNIADLARHRRPNIRFEVQCGGVGPSPRVLSQMWVIPDLEEGQVLSSAVG